MKVAFPFALSLLALTSACFAQEGSSASSCAAIPLDLSGPRPALTLRVGDQAPVRAIFDSAALGTTVAVDQAAGLGLQREGPLPADFGAHGAVEGFRTTLRNASIGDYNMGDVPALALPMMLRGNGAMLSPASFGDRLIILDLAASEMRICPRPSQPASGDPGDSYSPGPRGVPTIKVSVNGENFAAFLDTGAPRGLGFPLRYADQLALSEPLTPAGRARSHAGEVPIYRSRLEGEVWVGPLRLGSPVVLFSDVIPEPHVGTELLRQLTITIDPVTRRSWTELRPSP